MDVAVAPYTPSENFYFSPIKIFEYMAAARPVVAGAIGQIEELIVDGETGLLFEPGRTDRMAEALERLVRDPELKRRIGENGSSWVRRERTWTGNARKVVEIAQGLKDRPAPGAAASAPGPGAESSRALDPGVQPRHGIEPASREGAR